MSRKSKSTQYNGPEFIVSREFFDRYFEQPMPTSTFHDKVNEGTILRWPQMRGRYYLNASLIRLGMPTVAELPEAVSKRSLEDVARLAFTTIDPVLFPAPPWLLHAEVIDSVTGEHARLMADVHRDKVQSFGTTEEKLGYFAGVLDAQYNIENTND